MRREVSMERCRPAIGRSAFTNGRRVAKLGCALAEVIAMWFPIASALAQSDPADIWTLQEENAALSLQHPHDHFYTNGLRLGWTSSDGIIGSPLGDDGATRLALGLFHRIDTPADTGAARANSHDEPYAGVLLGEIGLVTDTSGQRVMTTLGLGIAGPSAGAEELQNGFHTLIGHPCVRGWAGQIPDTPLVEASREWTWRHPTGVIGELETDLLPAVSASIGTLRDAVQTGVTIRLGQGLAADFGVSRPRFGLNGGDVFRPVRPFGWYVFAGVDGQAVAYDALLQSTPFRTGPAVPALPVVAEGQTGLALISGGTRITFAYVVQSPGFRGQVGGLHQYASISLSVRF